MLSITEFDIVGPTQTRPKRVGTHTSSKLIVAPKVIFLTLRLQVEICNGGMVASVLTEDLGTVCKVSLKGFTQDGVEGLELRGADIQGTQREGNDMLEAL